jgi:hypothetical protein
LFERAPKTSITLESEITMNKTKIAPTVIMNTGARLLILAIIAINTLLRKIKNFN